MWNLNDVIDLDYRGGYRYWIAFDDGLQGEIDFTEYFARGPVFAALKDLSVFCQAHMEGGSIAWPNGADIAPETLHEKLRNIA